MPVVPVVPTFTDGVLTAAQLLQLADCVQFGMAPPEAVLRQTVSQNVTTGTYTAINFDVEDSDSAGGHDPALPSRYTAVYPGRYEVTPGGCLASSATGRRLLRLIVNSSLVPGSMGGMPAAATVIPLAGRTIDVYLGIGDYVEAQLFQDSGGTLATFVANAEFQASMTIRWVGIS